MYNLNIRLKVIVILVLFYFSIPMFGSELKEDEDVIIYPGYIYLDSNSKAYKTKIHIQAFKKKEGSIKRKILIDSLKTNVQFDKETNSKLFEERLRWFLVDNKRGKNISVTILGDNYKLNETEANGHSITEVSIPATKITTKELSDKTFNVKVDSTKKNNKLYEGSIFIIHENSTCLISDIDDTIKISDVRNKKKLLQNSFVNPYLAAEGMQKKYSALQSSKVSCFLFVSASPWQLYPIISQFFSEEKFPSSVYLMKYFRIKDSSFLNLFEKPENYKIETIEPLIKDLEKVKFILVGDSGEKDPEAYARLALKYPERITKIYIRKAYDENLDERIKSVFQSIPSEKYQFFKNPDEIK